MRKLDHITEPTIDDYNKLFNLQIETSKKLFTLLICLKDIKSAIGDNPYIGRMDTKKIKNKVKEAELLCS